MTHVTTHQAEDDSRNETILIYLNGRIVPKAEALVSGYDSGFMLGDGVWEGLRLYDGRWAFLDDHMDRLFEAAKAIDLDIAMTRAEVKAEDHISANAMPIATSLRSMISPNEKGPPLGDPF